MLPFLVASEAVRQILPNELHSLQQNRYVALPNWLSEAETNSLHVDTLAVDAYVGRDCKIGTDQSGTRRLDSSVRRSRQSSIYPPPPNSAGCTQTRASLIEAVDGLREELQAAKALALPHLEPFETELNYLLYPVGGHYRRHLDCPYEDGGWQRSGRKASEGGSFSGARTRRVVSFILYLNPRWDASDGGALRLFPAHDYAYGVPGTDRAAHTQDILPEGGTLVIMMSGEVEHLVRETRRPRQCIVGWFRESQQVRVPDLATTSLRTLRLLDRTTTVHSCRGRAEVMMD